MNNFKPFDSRSISIDILSSIAEISGELFWISDLQNDKGIFISSSLNNEKFGLPDNPSPVDWMSLIREEDREKIALTFSKTLADKSTKTFQQEYRVNGKDGDYNICESVQITRDAEGNALLCIGVIRDVTDDDRINLQQDKLAGQQQINRELRESRQRLKESEEKIRILNERLAKSTEILSERELMLKTSQQIAKTGSWKLNLKTGYGTCSEEFYAIYGLDPDFDLTDPEFFLNVLYGTQKGSEILMAVNKLKTHGTPFDVVSCITTSMGMQRYIRLVGYPLYTGNVLSEIQGVVQDITIFKETEERLRASEEKFFTLFKFTPDFMSLARESDGVIVEVNDKAQIVSGYTENEMVGKTAKELNLWVNPENLDDYFREYAKNFKATYEGRWKKKDGQLIYIMLSSVRVPIGGENFRLSLVKDITDRKEAEEKFSKAFSLSPDLMSIIREKDEVIIEVNENGKAMLGYTREEVLGKTTMDLNLWVIPGERDIYYQNYKLNPKITYEARWRKKNGEEIYVIINATRVELYHESYILSSVRDITARKQAEEKFKTAFTLSPDVMAIMRQSDLTILDINEKINEMLGYTRDELIGKPAGETMRGIWFNEEDRAEFYKNFERREPVFEIRWRNRSGNEVFVLMSSAFIELSGERCVLTIAKDITARKQAEEKFQTIYRLNPDMIAIVRKKDSIIVDVNDKVYDAVGYTKEELVGQRTDLLDIWLSEEDRRQGNLNPDNPTAIYEARLKNKKGEEVFVLVSGAMVELMGEPHLIYITKDITDRKRADEEAKQNIEHLAYAEKKLSEARVMALRSAMNPHFIFNALNSIQFFISKNEREQAIQYLSTFSKLIRGILTSSGQNMIKLADELELLKHYINLELIRFEKKFNVTFNIEAGIDKEIDIPALVIQPFVENAILHGLYSKSVSGNLKISVRRAGAEFIFFEIEDDGIGRVAARKVQAQKNLEHHKSLGVSLAEERLKIINSDPQLAVETEDLVANNKAVGTRVKIWLRIQ